MFCKQIQLEVKDFVILKSRNPYLIQSCDVGNGLSQVLKLTLLTTSWNPVIMG